MKKDVWTKIQNEFNSLSMENPRSALVLKNKYDNIKRNIKKQYADEKAFHQGTGGGPAKSFTDTSLGITVGELLQTKMTGEPSIYDSDNMNVICETEMEATEKEECSSDNVEEEIVIVDFEAELGNINIIEN